MRTTSSNFNPYTECHYKICEKSFVRKAINFSFSLELKHRKTSTGTDYNLCVLNTGTTDMWIHCFHFHLIHFCKYEAKLQVKAQVKTTNPILIETWVLNNDYSDNADKKGTADPQIKVESMDGPDIIFLRVKPTNRMSVMTLDQKFRDWIQQFNSKQIRTIKERLHTAYIVPDGSQALVELKNDFYMLFSTFFRE